MLYYFIVKTKGVEMRMNLGQQLKDARIKANLTQREVSEAFHVTRQTISNWENERSTPDLESLVQLSKLYKIDLNELLAVTSTEISPTISETKEESRGSKRSMLAFIFFYLSNIILVILSLAVDYVFPNLVSSILVSVSHGLLLLNLCLLAFFCNKLFPIKLWSTKKTFTMLLKFGGLFFLLLIVSLQKNNLLNFTDAFERGFQLGHDAYLLVQTFSISLVVALFQRYLEIKKIISSHYQKSQLPI
jgi:transcriptional regulator with XRE-family HTH domain